MICLCYARHGWLVVLAFSLTIWAQQPPQKPASPPGTSLGSTPIFKSQSELVLVPVVVRKKGKFVTGLTKGQFSLEQNRKPQAISTFEEIRPSAGQTPPPQPDLGYSNVPFDYSSQLRLTIIILDLLDTTLLQRADARDTVSKFLESALPPGQSVSLLSLTIKGLQPIHPFSTDRKALIESLKALSLGPETVMPHENRVFLTINEIADLSRAYSGIPGRKTLIFAWNSLPELVDENGIVDSSPFAGDLHRMWNSLINSNMSVYFYRLMDWARNPVRDRLAMHAMEVAQTTGGGTCDESNQLMRCLTEAVEDSGSYYMLGFAVQPGDRKPGWRDLKVKVSVEHTDVRALRVLLWRTAKGRSKSHPRRHHPRAFVHGPLQQRSNVCKGAAAGSCAPTRAAHDQD